MNDQRTELSHDNLIRGGVSIHPRLLSYNYELNFVKIRDDGKGCLEKRWPTRVIKGDNSSLRDHMKAGGSYGVQANHSKLVIDGVERQLVIIDFDSRELQDKVLDKFPKTFTTTSGSSKNCFHIWLATDRHEKKFAIKDKENNTLADVLGESGQVVAPGSKHPSGSTYRAVLDVPIAYMPYDEILEILKPFQEATPKEVKEVKHKDYGDNSFWDMVMSSINVIDILNDEGIDTSKKPTQCPFSDCGSVSNECFSFNDETWKCHSSGCNRSGNLFQLVRELRGLNARETFEWFADKLGLEEELKQHQINYMKGRAN